MASVSPSSSSSRTRSSINSAIGSTPGDSQARPLPATRRANSDRQPSVGAGGDAVIQFGGGWEHRCSNQDENKAERDGSALLIRAGQNAEPAIRNGVQRLSKSTTASLQPSPGPVLVQLAISEMRAPLGSTIHTCQVPAMAPAALMMWL